MVAIKTLAIRLEEDLHSQVVLLANLDDVPLVEFLRQSVEAYVAQKRSEPGFAERAQAVLDEIDQEARARRDAIQALFEEKGTTGGRASGRKSRSETPEGETE